MFKTLWNGVKNLVAALTDRVGAQLANVRGDSTINPLIAKLLHDHGVDSTTRDGWILVENHPFICGAVVHEIQQAPDFKIVQIDIYVRVESDRILAESFGGFGQTKEEAITDGFQNFMTNSFHVILAAFFLDADDQVETEQWTINGHKRRVVIGNFGVRGALPSPGELPLEWFKDLETQIKSSALPTGTHWVRSFYCQIQGQATDVEVLLDNDNWLEAQSKIAEFKWPKGEELYSVRVFLIIQDKE